MNWRKLAVAKGLIADIIKRALPAEIVGASAGGSTPPVVLRPAAVGNNSSAVGNAVLSRTWAHTVAAGANRFLLVYIANQTITVTTCSYDGVALTPIDGLSNANNSAWYMVNPPVGTANIVVTFAASQASVAINACNYVNVNQVTPFGAVTQIGIATIVAPFPNNRSVAVTWVNANGLGVVCWRFRTPTANVTDISAVAPEVSDSDVIEATSVTAGEICSQASNGVGGNTIGRVEAATGSVSTNAKALELFPA